MVKIQRRLFFSDICKALRSRRFAGLFIVVIIALLVLASIIPQKQRMTEAETFRLSLNRPGLVRFISITGLDHIYTTWWFLLIIFLTSLNLVLNLKDRLVLALRQFRDNRLLPPEGIKGLPFTLSLPFEETDKDSKKRITGILAKLGYGLKEHSDGVFAIKGRIGYWNVPLLHGSFLIILMGILISSLTKFSGNFEISEGQTFQGREEEFLKKNYGILELLPKINFQLKLRKFTVEYWDQGQPKSYRSFLDVYEGGKFSFSKNIEINEPLQLRGLSFYQSRYHGYSAHFSRVDKIIGKVLEGYVNFPYSDPPSALLKQNFLIPYSTIRIEVKMDPAKIDNLFLKIRENGEKEKAIWDGNLTIGEKVDLEGSYLVLNNIVKWTGIYVSRDLGVPVVYTGFTILIAALLGFIFVIPHTLMILYEKNSLLIGARALRDREAFSEEFQEIVEWLEKRDK